MSANQLVPSRLAVLATTRDKRAIVKHAKALQRCALEVRAEDAARSYIARGRIGDIQRLTQDALEAAGEIGDCLAYEASVRPYFIRESGRHCLNRRSRPQGRAGVLHRGGAFLMVASFTSATVLLHLTIGIQTAVIVLLVLLLLRVGIVGERSRKQLVQARRERNNAEEQLATLRRMSEIRLDVVARLGGFGRDTE